MAYISSNYVYSLFVCASAVKSECEIQKRCVSLQYTMYITNSQKVLP